AALAPRCEEQVLTVRRPARVRALLAGRGVALGLAAIRGRDPDLGMPAVLFFLHRRVGEVDEAAVRRERGRADGGDTVPVRWRESARSGVLLRCGLGGGRGRACLLCCRGDGRTGGPGRKQEGRGDERTTHGRCSEKVIPLSVSDARIRPEAGRGKGGGGG